MDTPASTPTLNLRVEIQTAIRDDAIKLLQLAHKRLNATDFKKELEENITGELVRAMNDEIELANEIWMSRYIVEEEKPLNAPSVRGKKRRRIDIRIVQFARRGRRPDLLFEAKRLIGKRGVSDYFGKDGIGCFLAGAYPLSAPSAGMIGYVQDRSLAEWQEQLARYAKRCAARLKIVAGGGWRDFSCPLPYSSISEHTHPDHPRLQVVHLLLLFC